MDFKSICRICLKHNKQNFDIYTSYYAKRNTLYCEMISYCTKIKPKEDDHLPRIICKECSRQLKRCYSFNVQCEESDKTLKCYLDNILITPALETDSKDVNDEIKSENIEVKNENFNLMLREDSSLERDVKLEPFPTNDHDDSVWDAEDDNVLLGEIKLKKTLKESISNETNYWEQKNINNILSKEERVLKVIINGDDLPKKKRGRKKKEYEGDSKIHQCDVCGKILSTKSNLKAHKICHTDLRPYKCEFCPSAFRGHSALFQHKKVHTGETPYHCEYCSKQFSRRTGLVNHIRVHTGEKLFNCTICFKNFVQSAQLSIHMKRHKGDKTYLCQECGKGFPIKADLKVHQRTHNGEKPYSCHLCDKTFATSGNLSIHIRIHNKEVRYNCKECHRGFVTCSAYNVHLKRHKGQRDYHCECGKTFYTSSALKQHKVVHTGIKKYQCKICERKFSQTSHLSRHFRRDHSKPNLPMPPSEHYKIVLPENKCGNLFNIQKMAPDIDSEKLKASE
ncbi:unnamed protein product [Danaus chrysippus]|uniref:Zinc finger protein unc-98 n=1 Tax=Danaus chrysippus TaxID=151541 RepID=A0A8J2QQB9_9NEOP|nr:unnamed protein product [Danaus chrysippus]